jgi:hypothetical protein
MTWVVTDLALVLRSLGRLRPLGAGQHPVDLLGKHDQFRNVAAAVPR